MLRVAGGRLLGYAEYGDADGYPVLAFHGTPGCRFMFRLGAPLARERGLRLIAPDRPGYGLSSPVPKRSLRDWPADVARLADHLALGEFAVLGVSGGGPFAAAAADQLGERVCAAAMVSPVGPVALPELASRLSGEHRTIFLGMARSRALTIATFTAMRLALLRAPAMALRGLIARAADVDREILLRADVSQNLIESLAEALADGITGAAQDLWLFTAPWDIDLAGISLPCRVWQGDVDRNVPPAAARTLAAQIPGCEFEILQDTGHYWIYDHFATILDWIACRIGARTAQGTGS